MRQQIFEKIMNDRREEGDREALFKIFRKMNRTIELFTQTWIPRNTPKAWEWVLRAEEAMMRGVYTAFPPKGEAVETGYIRLAYFGYAEVQKKGFEFYLPIPIRDLKVDEKRTLEASREEFIDLWGKITKFLKRNLDKRGVTIKE